MADEFGRTMVFIGGALGDALFHIAHLEAIAARAHGGAIVLACKKGPQIEAMFGHLPYIDRVLGIARDEAASGYVKLWRTARRFRRLDVETIWCLQPSATVAAAARLAGIERRYGFYEPPSINRYLYSHGLAVDRDVPVPVVVGQSDRLLRHYGLEFDHANARLPAEPDQLRLARSALKHLPRPRIALGINSSVPEKQWGGKNFARLVQELRRREKASFVLFGGPDVAGVARDILDHDYQGTKPVFYPADGSRSLVFDHAVLGLCDLQVGNNSLALTLAAFCGIPSVGLFGTMNALTYSPLIHPVHAEGEVRSPKGMTEIPVAAVVKKVRKILRAGRGQYSV